MAGKKESNSTVVPNQLTITRVFDAPRELVFKAWTDKEQMAKWWGPKDFTNPVCEIDARPGGSIYIDMTGPDGTVYPMGGEFVEVKEPERLVFFARAFKNKQGEWLLENKNTITFTNDNGKTKMVLYVEVMKRSAEVEDALAGMNEGWNQSLDRLSERTSKDNRYVFVTRIIDAPRDIVYKAWTDPEQLAKWFAPRNCEVKFAKADIRPGGTALYSIFDPRANSGDNWCLCTYKEVSPDRIVCTLTLSDEKGTPGNPEHACSGNPDWPQSTEVIITFTDYQGKTKLTLYQAVSEKLANTTGALPSWLQMIDKMEELIK